ncbi:mCG1042553, partial [Mus musculus]
LVPKPGTLTYPKTVNLSLLCACFLATLYSPLFYPRSFPNSWVTLCLLPGNFMLTSILSEVLPKLLGSQVSLTVNLPCWQPLTAESSELGGGVGSPYGPPIVASALNQQEQCDHQSF